MFGCVSFFNHIDPLPAKAGCFRRTGTEPTISSSFAFDIANIIYIIYLKYEHKNTCQPLPHHLYIHIVLFMSMVLFIHKQSCYIYIVEEMIIDQVVWNVIKNKHCAFRLKTQSQNFCKNENNLTGLCNRKSCPLSNSQYATIKQQKGVCYLYMKTAERSHLPSQLWQKVRLNKSYPKALEQIDQHLIYWSPFIIHKCKQRLTKLRQMIIQTRKLKLQGKEEIVGMKKKAERRDRVREAKALIAANIEQKIEEELMERLKTGVYKDIYNYNPKIFNKLVSSHVQREEQESLEEISQEGPFVEDSEMEGQQAIQF